MLFWVLPNKLYPNPCLRYTEDNVVIANDTLSAPCLFHSVDHTERFWFYATGKKITDDLRYC